ncbi:unnamed protein product [Dimorphilus gyrociliatus]|uniref:Actin maturation protease n=1 Tax=Dimorphilus gyrociliatus TaxID=2664684 RepID=A0A7I8W411_9ANNE|nr:unnamed protein product [Dimorphilus gyrociliatus]
MVPIAPPPPPLLSGSAEGERVTKESSNNWSYEKDLRRANDRIWSFLGPSYDLSVIKTNFRLQNGPQCGLVVLELCCNLVGKNLNVTVEELLSESQRLGFTRYGELFSCYSAYSLATNYLNRDRVELVTELTPNKQEQMLNGLFDKRCVILFPYDKGPDHGPVIRKGHSAHWCLLIGAAKSQRDLLVLVRQGKSKWMGVYKWNDMLESNRNLVESSPTLTRDFITKPFCLANTAIVIYTV